MLSRSDKSAPTAQHLRCPQPPFPNFLSKRILVYTSSLASSSSNMLFGLGRSGLVPTPNLSNAAALQVDDNASIHPSFCLSIHPFYITTYLAPMVVSVGDGGGGWMDTLDKSPPSCEAYPDTQATEFAPMDT